MSNETKKERGGSLQPTPQDNRQRISELYQSRILGSSNKRILTSSKELGYFKVMEPFRKVLDIMHTITGLDYHMFGYTPNLAYANDEFISSLLEMNEAIEILEEDGLFFSAFENLSTELQETGKSFAREFLKQLKNNLNHTPDADISEFFEVFYCFDAWLDFIIESAAQISLGVSKK